MPDRKVNSFLFALFFILLPVFAFADEGEVKAGFEKVLDLWRAGEYAELYSHTTGGKMTREAFIKRFAESALKPTCCWDKLQDVKVTMQTSGRATLRGTLTLESPEGTETKTKAFKLSKEDGVWKTPQSEIVSLLGKKVSKKKKSVTRKKP